MDEQLTKLGVPLPSATRRWVLRIGLALLALFAIAAGVAWRSGRGSDAPRFATAPIVRGELVRTVTATGTLRPRNTVEIGPEISGRVARVEVDANDHVHAGQLLAEIDTTPIDAQVASARANLASASAGIEVARASLAELERTLARVTALHARALGSDAERDQAEGAVERARAELAAARARAGVARAELERVSNDLARARIVSPIDGVVLARTVEPGQSVAATLSSPIFFVIAESLDALELEVTIDEADIAHVREGMEASFRVDAYPDREFAARIRRVHLASRTVLNVVTYPADLSVDNAEGLLRPGMTATATIVSEREPDRLLVPNAALRFAPPVDLRFGGARPAAPEGPTIWLLASDTADPSPLAVEPHGTDGRATAITGEGVREGLRVITGLARDEASPPSR